MSVEKSKLKKLRLLSLLLLLALLLTACGETTESAAEIVDPSDNFYVSDYAEVLSSDTESYIQTLNGQLEAACGGQIVVVTLDFLNGLDAEQYAYEILNQWGVGDEDENNGVVLLLVPGEGKCWITVGAGLEEALTAGVLESMLETHFYDDFDNGDYDAAVYNTVSYLENWFADWYGVDLSGYAASTPAYSGGREPVYAETGGTGGDLFMIIELIFFVIVIVFIVGLLGGMMNRRRCGGGFFIFPFCTPRPRPPRQPRTRGPRGPGGMGGPRGPGGMGGPGGRPGGGMGGGPRGGGGGMGRGGGGMGRGGGAGRK